MMPEFSDGEGERSHELLMSVDDVLRDLFVEQGSVCGQGTLVLVFVAVRGEEIGAIGRAVNRDFALCAAADGANLFALGGAKSRGFALFANRAGHLVSSVC